MNLKEARAWLAGERSTTNSIPQDPFETWQIRIAQADAAMTKQAYWIAKAYEDNLMVELKSPKMSSPFKLEDRRNFNQWLKAGLETNFFGQSVQTMEREELISMIGWQRIKEEERRIKG